MASPDLQQRSFEALGFSRGFCEQGQRMGITSLEEAIAAGPERLILDKNFTYHWLAELADYLNRNESVHILQPIPGSITG